MVNFNNLIAFVLLQTSQQQEAVTPDQLLLDLEIEHTKEVISLYEQKIMQIHTKIANETRSLTMRDQEFEYLMNLAQNEVINTP